MKNMVLMSCMLLAGAAACNESKKTAGTNLQTALYNRTWLLRELEGQPVNNSAATLAFTAGDKTMVTGSTGCNRLTGEVVIGEHNAIHFLPLATTRMACLDEQASATEKKFTGALTEVNGWEVSGNQLQLKKGDAVLATFREQRTPTAAETTLNGTWELNYLSGTKIAFEGLFPDKKPIIVFNLPEQDVTGNGGCNGYSCKVTVKDNRIQFGDALSTRMACNGNGEPLYFKALRSVTSYSISDNTLTMITGDIALMRFTKK